MTRILKVLDCQRNVNLKALGIVGFLRQSPGPCNNTKYKRVVKGQDLQKDFFPAFFVLLTALKDNEVGWSVHREKPGVVRLVSLSRGKLLLCYSEGSGMCGIHYGILSAWGFN